MLVTLALIWKTSQGNLERRFRHVRETATNQRSQLLDVSLESCMLITDHAPPSKTLLALHASILEGGAAAKKNYCSQILALHERLHGPKKQLHQPSRAGPRAERRDAGMRHASVSGRPGPETEAAFGRKREAAVAGAVAASPSKRARMVSHAPSGLAQIAREVSASAVEHPVTASASAVERAAKRGDREKDRFLRGAAVAAKARAKREERVVRSRAQPLEGRDVEDLAPACRPGLMLARLGDAGARRKGQQMKFKLTSDPVEFVTRAARVPASSGKGNVVLVPVTNTDYSLSAQIAAALMGGYTATAQDFQDDTKRPLCGVMHQERYKASKQTYHVAVSARLAEDFPTVPQVLEAIARAPGSCFQYYRSTRSVCKFFKKAVKKAPKIGKRTLVLAHKHEINSSTVDKKYLALYHTPHTFLQKFHVAARALCPGCGRE